MARYINADMLLKELDLRETCTTIQLKQGDEKHRLVQKGILSGLNWSRNIIYNTPTADVEEVKHGEWLDNIKTISTVGLADIKAFVGYRCSVCGREEVAKEPYCNCGAKMDR